MELLGVVAFIGAWVLLGILSNRFGDDSRDRFYDPPGGTLVGQSRGKAAGSPGSGRKTRTGSAVRASLDGIASRRAAEASRAVPVPTRNSLSLL